MSYRVPSVTINGDTRNCFNKPLIAAYSVLLATGDAVVETHEDLSAAHPGLADYEARHRAARLAHEEARMHDHAAQVLLAETIRIEWLETGEKTLEECLQACEGFHVDEAILRRVVERQDAVKAFMARLNAPFTVPAPVPAKDGYTGVLEGTR
ncbi:hypothetical protein JHFBIEKO_0262 [Methylobacterium mesophilicum]|uniref:hypothetical protein n=1 Tax=Methylobacterium mesophilicum TaxID=39956 RepID=UPI001EE2B4EA|nr:hypothetical protein [Methylobacterium mesophilicum]GJE19842.1 hypothetical protein JHFBIEKO_0262 [Methylobacterium mesophilicum]